MVEIVSMLRMLWFYLRVAVGLVLFLVTPILAAARLEPLTVGYSNVTATYAPLWIAVDENIGTKYGLDLKAIYAGRVRPQQLLATGDVPIVVASGTGTLTSHIVGVKDQVLVATITSKIGTLKRLASGARVTDKNTRRVKTSEREAKACSMEN